MKIWVAENCKPGEINRKMCNIYGEACFSEKNPDKFAHEKVVHGIETHWLSSKEKVPGTVVSKEGHPDKSFGIWKKPLEFISL